MEHLYDKQIQEQVLYVKEKIATAAMQAGKKPQDITLVGVTKTQPVQAVKALLNCGVTTLGENKVQELLAKEPELADIPHQMHLIGHLQRNKAKFLPGHINMLQSLDSENTVKALEKAYEATDYAPLDVLIEVNIGEEPGKSGVLVSQLDSLLEIVEQSHFLELRGLMAIPPKCKGEEVRRYFEKMYHLFIDIQHKKRDNKTVNILSMGMSADFEYAILEGATMVRVGTTLFGARQY